MNIKEWKKFSDAVDKYNNKINQERGEFAKELSELNKKDWEKYYEFEKECKKENSFPDPYMSVHISLIHSTGDAFLKAKFQSIEKNETNFYEWKSGKLKL